jgi:alpha-D-ribose 1-methylphosphonate 5-triphosphate synthase subunit PhnH
MMATMAPALAGLSDPVHDGQRIFRAVLDALSRPGKPVALHGSYNGLADLPAHAPAPLTAVLLALADHETPVWLDPHLTPLLSGLLRFHCGAPLVSTTGAASFAAFGAGTTLPPLQQFAWGSAEYPDRGCTLLVAMDSLQGGQPITLRGPGILDSLVIAPQGLPDSFWSQRSAMQQEFPLGVDCLLFDATCVVGLPRTTLAIPGDAACT